ncbi:MAG: type II toxin-antitoxin system PemK/MazF family toxin [Dehalococcoidia bacterium]|nr:type II toxin-antitoxin system PemK/MazF family toxin [Dehalococcoidia bacterium]
MSIKNAFSRLGITGRKVQRGEIYLIADDLIVLPETRLPSKPGRELHENRPVLILQTNLDNDDPLYLTILAAPLSHRVDLQDQRDFKLSAGQAGLEHDSIVQLGLTQPVLKIALQGEALGKVDDITMNDIDAVLAANLGLIERPR